MQSNRSENGDVEGGAQGNVPVEDQTLASIRELLYGDTRRELADEISHLRDRQREFEDWVRSEFRKLSEDVRIRDQAQDEARRKALKDVGSAVEVLAHSIAKLAAR